MVAAISATPCSKTSQQDSRHQTPSRTPLLPSEKTNASLLSKKPKSRDITSRYLSTPSSSAASSRRCPSPPVSRAPPTPDPSLLRRSQSIERRRSTDSAKLLWTSTRSLSVSFQGESFSLPVSKQKPAPNSSPAPDRRGGRITPTRGKVDGGPRASENSKPAPVPASRTRHLNPLTRSLDLTAEMMAKIARSVRGHDIATADSESVSPSSSGRATPRAMVVPARFWQETNSRLRRLEDPGLPKIGPAKKIFAESPVSSPRMNRGMASPSKLSTSSLTREVRNPSPARLSSSGSTSSHLSITPSFASSFRSGKTGRSRVEEAHLLKILYNRHLQWRFVNARGDATSSVQRLIATINLYNAWVTTSELRSSVSIKRIQLQSRKQNLKLFTVLKEQISFLEDWARLERDHSYSLSGAIEDLRASTLRLPVTEGAKADIQKVKDAVGSAVDVMQAMGSSISSLLLKVEGVDLLVAELARVAAQERLLLARCKDLLSSIATMQVEEASLRAHLLQLKHVPTLTQL